MDVYSHMARWSDGHKITFVAKGLLFKCGLLRRLLTYYANHGDNINGHKATRHVVRLSVIGFELYTTGVEWLIWPGEVCWVPPPPPPPPPPQHHQGVMRLVVVSRCLKKGV